MPPLDSNIAFLVLYDFELDIHSGFDFGRDELFIYAYVATP